MLQLVGRIRAPACDGALPSHHGYPRAGLRRAKPEQIGRRVPATGGRLAIAVLGSLYRKVRGCVPVRGLYRKRQWHPSAYDKPARRILCGTPEAPLARVGARGPRSMQEADPIAFAVPRVPVPCF